MTQKQQQNRIITGCGWTSPQYVWLHFVGTR